MKKPLLRELTPKEGKWIEEKIVKSYRMGEDCFDRDLALNKKGFIQDMNPAPIGQRPTF